MARRLWTSLVAAITISAPASAQPATQDAVYLKDNNVIRGTLTEMIAGDHATVVLPDGQTARIVWSFIARIDRGGVTQPVEAAAVAPPPMALPADGTVIVHLQGEASDIRLETQVDKRKWAEVCSAPCDRPVPIGPPYRVNGAGMRPSRPFHLAGMPGERVVLVVDSGSTAAFVGGLVLVGVGGVALLGGIVTLIVAYSMKDTGLKTGGADLVGWTLTAAGAPVFLGGILLWPAGRTSVEQSVNESRPRAANDAWKRGPTWTGAMNLPLPSFLSVPLLQRSF
jgi:hypothetical protein